MARRSDPPLALRPEPHARLAGEMLILRPEHRCVHPGRGVDDRIGLSQSLLVADRGRRQQRLVLPPHHLEDLAQAEGRNDQIPGILILRREKPGVGLAGEVGEPRRGIDDVYTRSPPRSNDVSIPFSNPRSLRTSRTGMISIRLRYGMTCAFSPAHRPMASRIRRGMTTWNLGEMMAVSIPLNDRPIDKEVDPRWRECLRFLDATSIRPSAFTPA